MEPWRYSPPSRPRPNFVPRPLQIGTFRLEEVDRKLRYEALPFLESDDALRTLINESVEFPDQNPQSKRFLSFFSLHYPEVFSLKLLRFFSEPNHQAYFIVMLHEVLTENLDKLLPNSLLQMKPLLFHCLETLDSLPEPFLKVITLIASRIFNYSVGADPMGGWVEYIQYVIECIHDDALLQQENGWMLFSTLPDDCSIHSDFWDLNYLLLYTRICEFLDTPPNEKFHGLIFDSAVRFVSILKDLQQHNCEDFGNNLLPRMMAFIDRYRPGESVLNRLQLLADLARQGGISVMKFFSKQVGNVFNCMIRVAQTGDVSNDVRSAAMEVLWYVHELNMDEMKSFIMELSSVDIGRLITILLDMMLDIEENSDWFTFVPKCDDMHTSQSKAFSTALKLVSFQGKVSVVLPSAIAIILEYITDADWRKRHAGMITLGAIIKTYQMDWFHYFGSIEGLVLTSLKDPCPAVCWAAMAAIRHMSCNGGLPDKQYHHILLPALVKEILLPVLVDKTLPNSDRVIYPRSKEYAARVIGLIVKKFGLDDTVSLLFDNIVQSQWPRVMEEAVDALTSVAVLSPARFGIHYDETMRSLNNIMRADYLICNYSVRTKALLCMSNIVLKSEPDKFQHDDAIQALHNFCQHLGLHIYTFTNELMPVLLHYARIDGDLKNERSSDGYEIQTERTLAIGIVSWFAGFSGEIFSHWVTKVSNIFARFFDCEDSETKWPCLLGIPYLLIGAKSAAQNGQQSERDLADLIVQSLVKALHKETDDAGRIEMLNLLTKSIQLSGLVFEDALIQNIAEEIYNILRIQSEKIRAREEVDDIIQSAYSTVKEMLENFGVRFWPHLKNIMETVGVLAALAPDDKLEPHKEAIIMLTNFVHQYDWKP